MNIYVPGTGPLNPRIVILAEAPSYEEEEQLTPLVGPSGRFTNQMLSEAGINRAECWITNVSKYMVIPQEKGKNVPFKTRAALAGVDLNKAIEELRVELTQLQPNVIIAFGGSALWALTGKSNIQKYRGSILNGMGFKVIPTFHPAHILRQEGESKDYWHKQVLLFDLKRAKKQSEFKEIVLPRRSLNICKSSAQLYDFFKRNENNRFPSIDIEASNCIPICIGISFNKSEGITVPLWNKHEISDIPDSDLASIWILLSDFLSSHSVIGQNFGYDRDKIKRLGFIVKSLHSDTMLKAFCINPELPKNLAFNTSIYTEEPYYKDEGMYEGSTNDLFIGCARDACVTKEIDDAMESDIDSLGIREYYTNFILPLHSIYHYRDDNTAIEQIGFKVDEGIRRTLIEKYIEWDEKIRYDLFKLSGEYLNTGSNPQVKALLFDKWKLPLRSGTGEEQLTSLINSPQVKNPIYKKGIELILEDRRVKKTIGTYLYALSDYDGKMRTSYFLCLDTGRSATQQQEPPIRPSEAYTAIDEFGKRVKKKQARGAAFQTITKHGDIGSDVRTMYIPDDGHVFLQADSSQAEARVIFLLANDFQALKDIDEHDYHALTASWFFGGSESDYSKKVLGYESPIRFAGKTLRHAGHLGASKRRAAIELNTQARKYKIDFTISEATADKALKIFHAKQPSIKQVFQHDVIKSLERNRRLIAPVPSGIQCSTGGTRIFFERGGDELFRQAFSYLPQRTVSENTKGAALRIRGAKEFNIEGRAEWIKILVESHDSLLVQVEIDRKEEAATILKEELERPIDFANCSLPRGKLIIPCEVEEGYNYKDLSKFKWMVTA